ncbi:hypothetical protein ACM0CQ_15850 [Mycobacteroides abscessus subsp. abscessus]|uniref:hypothetical protein n=1 Tax=Mycobacteroides abscessus TaxID=36809 RepID=UPI0039EE7DB7
MRFTVTNTAAAADATRRLPQAAQTLRDVIGIAAQQLGYEEATRPEQIAEAVARWRQRQGQIERYENELMLTLVEAGASERSLATLMGLGRDTVRRRLEAARLRREEQGS